MAENVLYLEFLNVFYFQEIVPLILVMGVCQSLMVEMSEAEN